MGILFLRPYKDQFLNAITIVFRLNLPGLLFPCKFLEKTYTPHHTSHLMEPSNFFSNSTRYALYGSYLLSFFQFLSLLLIIIFVCCISPHLLAGFLLWILFLYLGCFSLTHYFWVSSSMYFGVGYLFAFIVVCFQSPLSLRL